MKKILLIIGLAATTTLLQAQGFIEFFGSVAAVSTNTGISIYSGGSQVSGTAGKTAPAASQGYTYVLLVATSTNGITTGSVASPVGSDSWTLVTTNGGAPGSLGGTNTAAPGAVQGNGGSSGIAVDLVAGDTYFVELVGYSSSMGSWTTVSNEVATGVWTTPGFFGVTTVGAITPFATSGAGDPTLFPTTWSNGTMTLYAVSVPEPTTIALAGLGGISMLLLRRRKS